MRIFTTEDKPENIAHKIYVFSTINSVYTLEESIGHEVWKSVNQKQNTQVNRLRFGGRRIFKVGFSEQGFIVIWRQK